jgi:ABC-2 type transport system permease protein
MEYLLSAPIPVRAVFLSKLIQSVAPVILLLLLLAGPGLVGLGYGRGYDPGYFLVFPVFIVLLVFSGAGLAAVMVMLLVRIVAPRRAAEAIALVGGVSAFFCSQSGQLMAVNDADMFSPDQIEGFATFTQGLGSSWNPIAWAGSALNAWAQSDWLPAVFLTAAVTAAGIGIFMLTLTAAERLYLSGWSRIVVSPAGMRKRRRTRRSVEAGAIGTDRRSRLWSWIPVPIRALVRKDFLLFRRDLRNLSQLILPVIMSVVWGLSFGRSETGAPETMNRVLGGIGLLMGVMMAWGFALRFGLGAFSLEGQYWWIVKTAPVRRTHVLSAKYLLTFLPSTALGIIFIVLLSFFSQRPIAGVIFDIVTLVIVLAGMSGLMLSFGIWTARFDWKDPREVQGGGSSGCLVTFASMLLIFFTLGVFQGLPILLVRFLELETFSAYAIGAAAGSLICLAIGLVPLSIAAGRFDTLGEVGG